MTRWLLNSAVIAAEGTYNYRLLSADEAADWLRAGPAASRIGYAETAAEVERLCGRCPGLSRDMSRMEPGDEALVVRLPYRVADPRAKGTAQAPTQWEYGLLTRVE